jgi:hypothetical protein
MVPDRGVGGRYGRREAAVGDLILLAVFVALLSGLLLSLEIGMRRAQTRR